MKLEVSKQTVWAASISDVPGGLAEKLTPLVDAGADLDFAIARRSDRADGSGVLFVTPLQGARQLRAARDAGFHKADGLHGLRAQGANRPGVVLTITKAIAEASINLRGLSAAALGGRCVVNLAFDSSADALRAARVLRDLD